MRRSAVSNPYRTCTVKDYQPGSIIAHVELSFETTGLDDIADQTLTGTIEDTLMTTFVQAFTEPLVDIVQHFVNEYQPDLGQVAVLAVVNDTAPVFVFTTSAPSTTPSTTPSPTETTTKVPTTQSTLAPTTQSTLAPTTQSTAQTTMNITSTLPPVVSTQGAEEVEQTTAAVTDELDSSEEEHSTVADHQESATTIVPETTIVSEIIIAPETTIVLETTVGIGDGTTDSSARDVTSDDGAEVLSTESTDDHTDQVTRPTDEEQ